MFHVKHSSRRHPPEGERPSGASGAPPLPDLAGDVRRLTPLLDDWGLVLGPADRERLTAFAGLVAHWNTRVHLLSRGDVARIVTRHVAESLALLRWFPSGRGHRVLDLGAGAGFPSLPVKIVRPDLSMCVVEANRKKALFLQEAVAHLGLSDCAVVHARAETLSNQPVYHGGFAVVTARAVAPLRTLLPLAVPFLAGPPVPGRLLVPHGREDPVMLEATGCVCERGVTSLAPLAESPLPVLLISLRTPSPGMV